MALCLAASAQTAAAAGRVYFSDAPEAAPGPDAAREGFLYSVTDRGRGRVVDLELPGGSILPAWSPNGRYLAFVRVRGPDNSIYVYDAADGTTRRLTSGVLPAWAPDSRRLAFVRPVAGAPQILIVALEDPKPRQLTTAGYNSVPTFSPDGARLAFWSGDAAGFGQIYTMNLEGKERAQLTEEVYDDDTPEGSSANAPSWLYNERIVFWSGGESRYGRIWTMKGDGSDKRRLTDDVEPASSDNPVWTPDGRVLFDTQRRGRPEIWIMNGDGRGQRPLVSDVSVLPARASMRPPYRPPKP